MPFKILGVRMDGPTNEKCKFVEFRISEVKYIKVHRPKGRSHHVPIYYTDHGAYAPILTLRDLTIALNPRGFMQLDNSTLVNTARIVSIEESNLGIIITFDDNTSVDVAKVSRKRKKDKS